MTSKEIKVEKVYGYVRKICPNCLPGNKNSKARGRYLVYETNSHIILKCCKCSSKLEVEKKHYGSQITTRAL